MLTPVQVTNHDFRNSSVAAMFDYWNGGPSPDHLMRRPVPKPLAVFSFGFGDEVRTELSNMSSKFEQAKYDGVLAKNVVTDAIILRIDLKPRSDLNADSIDILADIYNYSTGHRLVGMLCKDDVNFPFLRVIIEARKDVTMAEFDPALKRGLPKEIQTIVDGLGTISPARQFVKKLKPTPLEYAELIKSPLLTSISSMNFPLSKEDVLTMVRPQVQKARSLRL